MRSLLPVLAVATVFSVFLELSYGEKFELKVNLGGQRVNDWVPEQEVVQFEEGSPYTRYRGEMNGEPGDEDIEVFKTQRFSRNEDLFMHFPVPDGVYTITLLFAETYKGAFSAGARVFDVYLGSQPNGIKKVISSLDIFSQVGGLTPLRRKFKGVATRDGVTLALRPIKQNPQIAGIIFEGHSYQKTFLDELPTVPYDPSQPLPDFEAVTRTGPIVNPTEEIYDPQMNPKITKELKAAAAAQGIPASTIGQGPGGLPGMQTTSGGASPGIVPGAAPSVPSPTGFENSFLVSPGASLSASTDSTGAPPTPSDSNFGSPPSGSTFGQPSPMGAMGVSASTSESTFGESSPMNSGGFPPASSGSSFGTVPSAGIGADSSAQGLADSQFGAPAGLIAGASRASPPSALSNSGFASAQNSATASSFLPAGAPGPSTRYGIASPPAPAQIRYTGRRRLLQENAQASMMQRIQTLNQQIANVQQYAERSGSQPQPPSENTLRRGIGTRVRASTGTGTSTASAPMMGSTSAQGYSSGRMPRYSSIHQQMGHPVALPVSVRQAEGVQVDTPGAAGTDPSQVGGAAIGVTGGNPSGPGVPSTDPSQSQAPEAPAYPSNPLYPGASDPTTPVFPGGAEAPGSDVPPYPQAPGAPEQPTPPGPGMPLPAVPGSAGDVTTGPAGAAAPDFPGSAGDAPPAGAGVPGAPGAESPQYPNYPDAPGMPGPVGQPGAESPQYPTYPDAPRMSGPVGQPGAESPQYPNYPDAPGMPGPVGQPGAESPQYPTYTDAPGMPGPAGDAPSPGSEVPGAPGAQDPVDPGIPPLYPTNPSIPESPSMPVSAGDIPPTGQAPGAPGDQVPAYPGSPPIPGMPIDAPAVPGMPIEANAQLGDSPDPPGISRPGSALNGICINNSTHCSCGIAATPESPEEQTCLFIVNETSSPKVCQKSKCNAQFICGCAEGAPMLCERKMARTILTQVDLHQHQPATSQANIVLCERIEIEERIDILEPTLAG